MKKVSESMNDLPMQGVTYGTLVRAFTEWDRLWREDPDAYDSDIGRILRGQTIEEYGQAAMLTLLEMIGRVVASDEVVANIPNELEGQSSPVVWYELTDRHGNVFQHIPKEVGGHCPASVADQQYADKIQARLADGTYITLKDRHA